MASNVNERTSDRFDNIDNQNNNVYCVIRNIPNELHSADLRNFFSQMIESDGFVCFHFRHRPEINCVGKAKNSVGLLPIQAIVDIKDLSSNTSCDSCPDEASPASKLHTNPSTTTCCVTIVKMFKYDNFIKMYHRKHWLDRKGDSMPSLCFIEKIKVSKNSTVHQDAYHTRHEQKVISENREIFTDFDLQSLPELKPPPAMPKGNVGTPTRHFLALIKQCLLPAGVIKKLGLKFPRTRPRKQFSAVPYRYTGAVLAGTTMDYDEDLVVTDSAGHELLAENDPYFNKNSDITRPTSVTAEEDKCRTKELKDERIEERLIHKDADSEEDADDCEEWERHEAICDDPGSQDRIKERLYEEEIELKWEKGGSGLVFYTDAQYWQEKEGDFDEQTADDWDVDMSVYYDQSAGDKDAKDMLTMRKEVHRRSSSRQYFGAFEKHTKGIGRRVMENQGWSDGASLGQSVRGITDALGNEGQSGRDKSGFGYRGEKLMPFEMKRRRCVRDSSAIIISTCYDKPYDIDVVDDVYRRSDPRHLKYRRTCAIGTKHA